VRAAILALLAEEPRHGYSIMTELADRSEGMWRPSPGSVYPVLQQLQDEGLVTSADAEGRRVFTLTEEGRRYVEERAEELSEPWRVGGDNAPHRRGRALLEGMGALGAATFEVARQGTEEQVTAARAILDEARRAMYRLLAGDDESATGPVQDRPQDGPQDGSEDRPQDRQQDS
jgi:DNA-binding PadR family transcriptional regulator